MRRIAGTFMLLAAFSGGCNLPQPNYNQYERSQMYSTGSTTASGSSWQRNTPSQFPSEAVPDGPGFRDGAVGMVASQPPAPTPPSSFQTAAKPPYQSDMPQGYPSGYPTSTAPLPAVAELAASGTPIQPAYSNTIDPALKEGTWQGDRAAIEQTKYEGSAPARLPELAAQPLAVRMPEILLEPKMPPVTVSIDSQSSPAGAPALRLVSTKSFTLSYAVQDSSSGGTTVELWETRDCKTWKKCEHAQAHQGTYHVEVKDEGVFGYTMVARPQGDKSNSQPKAGDVPQVWVTVDATKPVVNLTGIELNLTSKTPNLIVRWTAKDKNFGPRPVTLTYAEHDGGPWLPLAANIENTGHYECVIPAKMPKRALIRIEAVDLVGNTGAAQTARSVRLDFMAPTPVANLLPPPPANQTATEAPRPIVTICNVESSDGSNE